MKVLSRKCSATHSFSSDHALAEHTDLGQCPLDHFPERVLLFILSLMRLETIEELPHFPHERPVTQSTNHFSLRLGFRTSVHYINHVNFLGPLLAAMSLGHTYLPSNSLLPQG